MTELKDYNTGDCTCELDHNSITHLLSLTLLSGYFHPLITAGLGQHPGFRPETGFDEKALRETYLLPSFFEVLESVGWQGDRAEFVDTAVSMLADRAWPETGHDYLENLEAMKKYAHDVEDLAMLAGWELVRP